jgi:hypothetical protein
MKRSFCIPLLIILLLCGCINLQKVGDYSSAALKGIRKFEEMPYTFDGACRDKCSLEQIRDLRLSKELCDCSSDKTADSVTSVLYNSVRGYFDGLAKLSSNDLTTYKTGPLAKALKSGQFGDVEINKAEVDAHAKIAALLLKAFANGYRRKKLREYIEAANESIQVLIRSLDHTLSTNLAGKLNIHKERTGSIYFDMLSDSLASTFDKKNAIEEYNRFVDTTEEKLRQIKSFSRGLKSIAAGHQKLYIHRYHMTSKEIKEELALHASDLEEIIAAFNQIKKK